MMLSNMISTEKKEDRKFLLEILLLVEQLIKIGTTEALDLAEKFGDHYVDLENKINTHNYKE